MYGTCMQAFELPESALVQEVGWWPWQPYTYPRRQHQVRHLSVRPSADHSEPHETRQWRVPVWSGFHSSRRPVQRLRCCRSHSVCSWWVHYDYTYISLTATFLINLVPSVLWCCSFDIMKSIWRVKNRVMRCWHVYLSSTKYKCAGIWSRWCHCNPIISCFVEFQIGLFFLMPAYPGCPGTEVIKWLSFQMKVNLNVFLVPAHPDHPL